MAPPSGSVVPFVLVLLVLTLFWSGAAEPGPGAVVSPLLKSTHFGSLTFCLRIHQNTPFWGRKSKIPHHTRFSHLRPSTRPPLLNSFPHHWFWYLCMHLCSLTMFFCYHRGEIINACEYVLYRPINESIYELFCCIIVGWRPKITHRHQTNGHDMT